MDRRFFLGLLAALVAAPAAAAKTPAPFDWQLVRDEDGATWDGDSWRLPPGDSLSLAA